MTRTWSRLGRSCGIARNAKPQLRVVRDRERPTPDNPYAALCRVRVPSNPFYAYRAFLRRLRHAA